MQVHAATPPKPMKLLANGIQINIEDRGHGDPSLVFLHYWGGSCRTWCEVIAQLSAHRSIALDHRGWGGSDAPSEGYAIADMADDAQGVVAALELKHYVIIGHSMGGKIAQLLASRRPAGLAGLILVAPSPPGPTVLAKARRDALLRAYDSRESVTYVRDHILTALPLTETQKERVIEDSLQGAAAAKRAWPAQTMLEDLRTEARRISVPTLVLSGEQDQVDPTDRLRYELLSRIPGARLQVLPRTGHLPMLEAPGMVAGAIGKFVATLPC
jgi:pimeloyl-ACP methyl ester carboxylesterase